jgi:hypothetical protein
MKKMTNRTTTTRRMLAIFTLCALLMAATQSSKAQATPHAFLDGAGTNAKSSLIIAALVTAVALIGLGVYFAARHGHTMQGCVEHSPDGLELHTNDGRSFLLLGDTTGLQAGDRVKVRGSRHEKLDGVSERPSFVVETLDKDYGSCTVTPSHS